MKKRFTLVEALVIIAIIATLAAIIIPNITTPRNVNRIKDIMVQKGIRSREPIDLGHDWYYLSSEMTNSRDTIASLIEKSGSRSVHIYPANCGDYGGWSQSQYIALAVRDLGITNGAFLVFVTCDKWF